MVSRLIAAPPWSVPTVQVEIRMGADVGPASAALFPEHDSIAVQAHDRTLAVRSIEHWLRDNLLRPDSNASTSPSSDRRTLADEVHHLRLAVEAFVAEWSRATEGSHLAPDDRRTGDALAAMASEVVKSEDPPRSVLLEAFRWFGHKVDSFAEEAARAAGKSFGTAAGAGAGLTATGQLPRLAEAAAKVLAQLT